MTSLAITLPRGPVPLIIDKSIFFSDAVFLARGEAPTLDGNIFSVVCFVLSTTISVLFDEEIIGTEDLFSSIFFSDAVSGFSCMRDDMSSFEDPIIAMGFRTSTSESTSYKIDRTVPLHVDSTSKVALSVSTSHNESPSVTSSPSDTFH